MRSKKILDGKGKGGLGSATEIKLATGTLYRWTTPTEGSADYYYLVNPKRETQAFKLGPAPGLVTKDFEIDWDHAIWEN